ncbi:MAG: UV DNA damage repair endonuclease UvsE [Deltaproteobacteria bacterium]|nr:UV DNA damage repair endonuclease UvsE [Deltaproteobacteria bacterium]
MARVGLCCTFLEAPIKFRTTTARYVTTLAPKLRPGFLNELAVHNVRALDDAIAWCAAHGVGAFRVNSGLLPLYTHPDRGWTLAGPGGRGVAALLRAAGARARTSDVRLSFHPDQFVVPGSLRSEVVDASLRELEYMGEVADLIGAEQITIHGGGAQPGKLESLARLAEGVNRLSARARCRLVLENDDRVYTVEDLLPLSEQLELPLIYDVHHHRCNPDRLSVDRATELAAETWRGREPWVHLSSPAQGWKGSDPRPHADYIDPKDVPRSWLDRNLTIDVEAKAKELAVLRLQRWIKRTTVAHAA